jgi:hypothetical protein
MGQRKESAAEIRRAWKGKGPCDIACRLCGVRVVDDEPDAVWQGFDPGLGGGFRIDEHEKCDAIRNAMDSSKLDPRSDSYIADLGIDETDRERAQRVLRGKLGHRWPLGRTGAA